MRDLLTHNLSLFAVVLATLITGCARKTGEVTVQSTAFNTSGAALLGRGAPFALKGAMAVNPTTTVTDFKICVRKVKLENEDDEVERMDEGQDQTDEDKDEIEFKPGLIDLTSGAAKSWGTMTIPVGFKLKKIKIKVKKDQELCGVDYSIKFNTATTSQDVEFKWKFEPPVDLGAGDKLSLALATVVATLRQAGDAGTLASLKEHVESSEGNGTED